MFHEQTLRPAFHRALLRMFRDGAVGDQSKVYREMGRGGGKHRVKLLWGTNDVVVSFEHIQRVTDMLSENGNVCWDTLEGAEHNLLISHPRLCAQSILSFLGKSKKE